MTKKTIISILLLMIILTSFVIVRAEVMNVECAKDSDCGNGEVCQKIGNPTDWYCTKTTGDTNLQNIPITNQESSNSSNSILIASIVIGSCIVVGFIILAIILRKKKK